MVHIGLKILWSTICFLGNVYQIVEISSNFFEYQITTTIHVNYPDEFFVPALGICYYETQVIDWDEYKLIRPNVLERLNMSHFSNKEIIQIAKNQRITARRKFQSDTFKGMNLREADQVTYNSSDLFVNCLRVKKDGASQLMSGCDEIFDIIPFKYQYFTCFTFNFRTENFPLKFLKSVRAETISGFLYFIQSSRLVNRTSDAVIFYNNNLEYQRSGYFRYIPISELENSITTSYDEYSNSLLKFPYVTKCSSYDNLVNITDRGSCYESCMKNESKKYLGDNILLPGIFIFQDMIKTHPNIEMLTVHEMYSNQTLVDMKDKVSEICNDLCSALSCKETFYIPRVLSSSPYTVPLMVTQAMVSPKIDTNCEPKLNIVVFFTNILSTFSFWIGLSVFSFTESLTIFAQKLYSHSRNKIIPSVLQKLSRYGNMNNKISGWKRKVKKTTKLRTEIENKNVWIVVESSKIRNRNYRRRNVPSVIKLRS